MKNDLIGKRMKERRHFLDMSVNELATVTGLSKATLHRYENGDIKNIKVPVVRAISFYLGVSPEWLIGQTDIIDSVNAEYERDMYSIINYANKLMKSGDYTNKGFAISKNTAEVLELTLSFQLSLLQRDLDKKSK